MYCSERLTVNGPRHPLPMTSLRLRPLAGMVVLGAAALVAYRWLAGPKPIAVASRDVAASASVPVTPATAIDPAACLPDGTPAGATFADAVADRVRREEALARTAEFGAWLTDWRRADLGAQPALAARGRELAMARRAALKFLIETDPRRALELAVPVGLRAELPEDVRAQLERRVDERGALEVSISHRGSEAMIERVVRLGDESHRAFVFGRRETQQTKSGLPLHGIAIDGALALDETPFRPLDDSEKSAHGLAPDQTAVFVGAKLTVVASAAEFTRLREQLLAAEAQPGPHVAELRSGSPETHPVPGAVAVTSPPSWINGTKRVLWLKIDFSDDAGAAYTDVELQTGSTSTTDFYTDNSQGKTTMAFSILPAVLRMPKTKAYYEASQSLNGELYTAARDAAQTYDRANGGTGAWDPDKFDRYLILHKRMATYLYGGVAQLGGPRVGLNNAINLATIGHELGHSQSLAHSHYWLPTGSSPTGAGSHVEYGDLFDIMGGGTLNFNASQKFKLGYLDGTSVTTVATAGTYRIARHDDRNAAGIRALKIAPADLGYEYWVEHRRNAPTSFNAAQVDRLRNGVLLHWGAEKSPSFTTGQGSYLLDATPGSAGGANDAPLRLGESFVDPDAGITIKPLAVGGAAPNEYIDVQVSFGAIDGNRNPTLIADAPAGPLAARTNIIFNASATDPDGDAVYYRWDFGDGSFQPNLGSITRRFTKGGAYALRVSAHDGKGGIAIENLSLTVADPLTAWTSRTTGVTNTLYGAIYAGGKFVVVGDNGASLTSTDGITWTRGTTPLTVQFPRSIAHNGARYATVGLASTASTVRAAAAFSTDGLTWTAGTVPANSGQIFTLAFGAGRFVAVGETGRIYNSTDGAAWTEVTSPINNTLRAIAYADNLFVATGDSGRILTSMDGVTWTNRSVATGNSINSLVRHQGQWFAAVSAFECFSSTDGAAWTRISTAGRTNSNNGQRLLSTSGVLLSSTNAGGITFAEDPRTWSEYQINSTANTTFSGLAEGAGQIVIVGPRGLIYTTAAVAPTPVLPAPSLRLEADSIKVAVGRKNVIAASGAGFVKLELYANGSKVSEITGSSGALSWTPTTIGNYLLTVRGIDATGASVVSAAYPAVSAFANWKWRNPAPVGADLRGAVRVDGKWWIVGGGGTLLTLDDSGNFTPVDFSTTQQLNAIAYANGRFVIATTDLDGATKEDIGGLWTSPDGYSWTPFLTGVLDSVNLNYVLYASDRWIGVGSGGTVVTSTNGINWPRSSSGVTQAINSAAFGAGLVVAVTSGGRIITSPDGLGWTERTSGVTTDLRSITFANGTFVAVGISGVILTSANGTAWTPRTSGVTTNLSGVGFVKNNFVVGGDAGVGLTSATGETWTAASINGNTTGLLFVAGSGEDGLLLGRGGDAYAPTTVASWRRLYQGSAETKQAVIYAGGRFVVVGQTTDTVLRATATPIVFSADGGSWNRAPLNTAFTAANVGLNAIAYGIQTYVTTSGAGRIFTSTDASAWTQRTSPVAVALNGLAVSPAGFLAVGAAGTILGSADGVTWAARPSGSTQLLRAAAFGNGRYVAVGDGGTVLRSTDGVTWSTATSGVAANLLTAGWWDDVGFLVTGASGTILNSIDGVTWQQRESGISDSIAALTRASIGFVAAAGFQGTMLVSLDGLSWSISALPADKTIRGLAASAGAIVAVGDSGAVLSFELGEISSPPVIVAQPLSRPGVAGDVVRFSVTAQNAAGAVYQWLKDGAPIRGANSPVYLIPSATPANAGTYTVAITTGSGTVTSSAASLSFGPIADPGRLINLSILTALTSAADSFIFGVVLGGAGTSGGKPLLVRAAGPSLTPLGVPNVLADPKLEFFTGTSKVGENDNWGGGSSLSAVMASVGAFAFSGPASLDAAISLPSLASGANSARISGTGAGAVIAELYDATPSGQFVATTPRLINVSVLKNIGTGVTAGFVIGGSSARTVLVRAIGPTLTGFGVAGALADPQFALFSGSTQLGANDNWGGTAALTAAFDSVGAFQLPLTSRDAALLATLQPGAYTVQVSGVGGTTGVALVEVYEVP